MSAMLHKLLETLCESLSLPMPVLTPEKRYLFPFSDTIHVSLNDLNPGVAMQANIIACPEKKREELLIFLMRANLLGQGTGGCRIGLTQNEKVLTLSLGLPYEINYSIFREKLEDFVNYLVYWREEITKFEQEMKPRL